MRLPVPAMLCNQSVKLTKSYQSETDMYGKPKQDTPITISKCVVHLATKYTGTNDNRQLIANGTVFFYVDITSPMLMLTKDNLGSKIEIEGNTYTIQTITESKQPLSDDLFAYKLEVL
ncbi:putative minor capsid protein [Oenococcus sicerae]|uniref:putative minor capsid protein n=1 Tax=Oenococcus sicerae TaxID=2203724 RepID=UPI0039E8BA95